MALGPVAQIHLSVTDIDRSVAFYRDVLKIPLLFQVDGQPMAFFQSGQVRLYLGKIERPEFRTHTVHYYEVDDIYAERSRLQAEGVEFDDEPHVVHRNEDSELWMTGFRDPDDHHIILMQERPR
jgi:catechol 2,3-dioxygenase-like lactoylglutathione lyase family enzyme